MADKFKVAIPKEVVHGRALFCPVEPPHDKMTIAFCEEGSDKPFLVGGISNRRCPEIAGFVFRPLKLNMETRQRDKSLVPGQKIQVIVTLYDKVEQPKTKGDKPKFSEPIQVVKETVTILEDKKPT